MYDTLKLFHLAVAIVWLGGMAFVLGVLRPVVTAQLQPPARLQLMAAVLGRFFVAVWAGIAVLLLTGAQMLAAPGMKGAPTGVRVMMGLSLLMIAIFSYLYFGPFRRLRAAVATANWPEAGRRMARIPPLVIVNSALGWLAVAAVYLLR